MNRGLLWTWRHEARKRAAAAGQTFVPIRIVGETTPPTSVALERQDSALETAAQLDVAGAASATGTIDIEMGGARVRVSGAVDAATLRQVLTYLRRKA
jgi:transposase-like protein